jgi:PTS system nitrogen regulatory IIA component
MLFGAAHPKGSHWGAVIRDMINISTKLDERAVASAVVIGDKTALFTEIGRIAAESYGLDPTIVVDRLDERERLGATGFGGGTAIPHCKYDGVSRPLGVFIRLSKALDYNAIDDGYVDLVFALISPSQDGAAHLRALAEISRMFRDENSCAQLRGAGEASALYALLTSHEERDAA